VLLAAATFQMATRLSHGLGTSDRYPITSAALFSVAAVFAVGVLADQHPFPRFGPANGVTSLRLALTSLVAGFLGEAPSEPVAMLAAVLALVSTVLDGADGWLARRTRMASPFGARFDMETDALLILVLATLAWRHDKAGAWIVLAGAMRYLFVAAGAVWRWVDAPLPPSQRRKAVCVVQIVGLGLVVSPLMAPPVSTFAAALTLAALTWSFGVDVLWLWNHRVRLRPDVHTGSPHADGSRS
jgi:phosphatidylglycerophosphate synthase